MNLPFGKGILSEQKMDDYQDTLENYKKTLFKISKKLEVYDKCYIEDRHASTQTVSEIIYLKEQGEKAIGLLEEIKMANKNSNDLENLASLILDMNNKVASLDKSIEECLSGHFEEMEKQSTFMNKQLEIKMETEWKNISKTINNGKVFLWILFVCNVFGLCALVFLILYTMQLLTF